MELTLIHTLWGINGPLVPALADYKAIGYGGVECNFLFTQGERRAELHRALDQSGLRVVPQCFTCAWETSRTVDEHLASFRAQLADAMPSNPLFINVHSGSDAWSLKEMVQFYKECVRIERDYPVTILHETHRGRSFFSPWTTRDVLNEVPELRLTADFSHWVCVAERIIDDQLPIIRQVAERAHLIHARVGFGEGPQVPDPRDPLYAAELAAHERWWDMCWDSMAARGLKTCYLTPEFGPFPYMHHLAYTNQPVADLWDINRWQGKRQAERFAKRQAMAAK